MRSASNSKASITNLIYARDLAGLEAEVRAADTANLRDERGNSALGAAAAVHATSLVEALLSLGADPNMADQDSFAFTPLIHAVKGGSTEAAEALLKGGASVNGTDSGGQTALRHACVNADVTMVRFLIDRGADVNSMDTMGEGETSLHHLCRWAPQWSSWKITRTHLDGRVEEIENPRFAQHAAVVRELLERGADPMLLTAYGHTALHCAAESGAALFIPLLVKHGAKVNEATANGYTALNAAANRGHAPAVQALLEAGADANAADAVGVTALMGAVLAQDPATVALLLKWKADPDAKTTGADPKAQIEAGDTARSLAERLGRPELLAV